MLTQRCSLPFLVTHTFLFLENIHFPTVHFPIIFRKEFVFSKLISSMCNISPISALHSTDRLAGYRIPGSKIFPLRSLNRFLLSVTSEAWCPCAGHPPVGAMHPVNCLRAPIPPSPLHVTQLFFGVSTSPHLSLHVLCRRRHLSPSPSAIPASRSKVGLSQ